ncbi:arylsulfatase [Sinomicrobium weinanense]|nr:arylsulfatase [Sinomicrobium weinanense]MBU3125938.1 arylsulfatase [Sinomicrobium weinanense]
MKIKYNGFVVLIIMAFLSCKSEREGETKAPAKKPNIVLIMADDMGFSDIASYGGEVETPNLDALAKGGVRYTQFYNNARCCPTRASLMTGLYPHQAGMGWMTTADMGTPEYQGELNSKSVTIAEVLQTEGYHTYMSGKWHLSRVRNIKAGIKDNWPSQRGFDRFFGIVDGASNYFTPNVFSDNKKYKAPGAGEDFYFTHAVSDSTVMFMDKHFSSENENPVFMYVAYTAPHWPLHALEKDIEKYEEMYNMGWDRLREQRLEKQKELGIFDASVELSGRDPKIPAWEELSKEKQEEFAKRMAIYAAQIDAMDQGIGRIVDKLEELGELDNTLLMFLSDNGACAEYISGEPGKEVTGKADTWESYRIHWANGGSTPYKEYKHWTHEGGIATPFIVHWPGGIDKKLNGKYIREPGHIMDIMATAIAVSGAKYPEKYKGNDIVPLEGKSLVPHFSGCKTNRGPIFWEHESNIGMRDGHWKLVAKTEENTEFDPDNLELYNMEDDPVELHNLAEKEPGRLKEMFKKWQAWADKVNVVYDTRDYGQRTRAYSKVINGEFENEFAGWQFEGHPNDDVFQIDSSGVISGKNSAQIKGKGTMFWPFFAKEGEKFNISCKAKADTKTTIKIRFESVSGKTGYYSELITLNKDIKIFNFNTPNMPVPGRYRLIFEFQDTQNKIWIDDVQLELEE